MKLFIFFAPSSKAADYCNKEFQLEAATVLGDWMSVLWLTCIHLLICSVCFFLFLMWERETFGSMPIFCCAALQGVWMLNKFSILCVGRVPFCPVSSLFFGGGGVLPSTRLPYPTPDSAFSLLINPKGGQRRSCVSQDHHVGLLNTYLAFSLRNEIRRIYNMIQNAVIFSTFLIINKGKRC